MQKHPHVINADISELPLRKKTLCFVTFSDIADCKI